MACILNIVLLDLSGGITDSFEGRGVYSRGGGLFEGRGTYCRIYGILRQVVRIILVLLECDHVRVRPTVPR